MTAPGFEQVWLVALLGALAGGDRTAFGQTLLAHPIVVGCLAAWAAGSPGPGVWFAVGITALAAARVPVGETRVRDWTSAALVGPFVASEPAWTWGVAMLLASVVASIGGRAIDAVRALALRADLKLESAVDAGQLRRLERAHALLVLAHFLRGGAICTAAVLAGRWAVEVLSARLDPAIAEVLAWIWWLTPAMGLPILLRFQLTLGSSRVGLVRWLFGGIALGLVGRLAWGLLRGLAGSA